MQESVKQSSEKAAPSYRAIHKTISTRALSLLAATLLLLIASLLAFIQTPRPNPYNPPATFSYNWWRYPVERHAEQRLPLINSNLQSVFTLPDTDRLWIVGSGGMILHSSDGGQSWVRQGRPTPAPKAALRFSLIPAAYAGYDPNEKTPVADQTLKKQLAAPSKLKLVTKSQQQQPTQAVPIQQIQQKQQPVQKSVRTQQIDLATTTLSDVFFSDQLSGWIAGDHGVILRTTNGGDSWQQQDSGTSVWLRKIQVLNAGRGWAVGNNGTILRTDNGGSSWSQQYSNSSQTLYDLHFINPNYGWVVGEQGTILYTSNGGAQWQPQYRNRTTPLRGIYFTDTERGWAAGDDGTILRTEDGGNSWRQVSGGGGTQLSALYFNDRYRGWAVGDNGAVLRSDDAGNSWRQLDSETNIPLTGISFKNSDLGYAVGHAGTILQTFNAGRSWQRLSKAPDTTHETELKYRRYPAPWYYLSWFLAAALLFPAIRKPKQLVFEQQSVADMLVSDKPLEAGEPDPLNFGLIARSLSRYLRNDNTQPPLTIAITGEWGTGKSSLMNLLKADLQRYGVQPVWFNAWHHQKESNLLASLLDNIRNQAVPSWWCPSGLNFRLRLLFARGWRNCLPVLLVLFVFAISLGIVSHYPGDLNHLDWQQVNHSLTFSSVVETLAQKFPFLTLSASSLTLLIALFRGFVAFGLDPKKLIPTIPGRLQVKTLNVELSFRQKFAREFKDVTQALQPHTMLILIDDLDRCQADHVLEILETINYLVSSGECYVVLGMARERVERCIGAAFKEVAEDMIDIPGDEEHPQGNGRLKRIEFARQYLEKLINIEVPVPVATTGQSQLLLAPEQSKQEPVSVWKQALQACWSGGQKLLPWTILLLVVLGGYLLGKWLNEEPLQQAVSVEAQQAQTVPTVENQQPEPLRQIPRQEAQTTTDASTYTPGQVASYPKSILLYPMLALLTFAVLLKLRRPDYRVQDSPEFVQALKVWHPLIAAKRNTPRSIKRFLNRVRYFAMVNRDQSSNRSKKRLSQEKQPAISSLLAEPTLVALGALHHVHPQLIKNDHLFHQLSSDATLRQSSLQELKIPQKLAEALWVAMQQHEKVFGRWDCTAEQRAIFLEISQGIQII